VIWEEYGRYPDIIFELMSPSTAQIDKTTKKELYERTFRTRYYFIYDPFEPDSLQGWELDATQHYQPIIPNENGWLWCDATQHWVGLWTGQIRNEPFAQPCEWLRLYTAEKTLVPIQEELAQQAQAEAQQAQAEAQQAQAEAQQAQAEAQQAQAEAQQAQARASQLAEKLRALGVDPDSV
jgi:hypothetical protein